MLGKANSVLTTRNNFQGEPKMNYDGKYIELKSPVLTSSTAPNLVPLVKDEVLHKMKYASQSISMAW